MKTLAQINQALLHGPARRRLAIPDVLPVGICFLFGGSGTGKSGIAILTSLIISAGLPWAGKQVSQGGVLYVAGEDDETAGERFIAAARELHLDPETLPIAVTRPHIDGITGDGFLSRVNDDAQKLAAQYQAPIALIVIDTLAACFGNDSQDDARSASLVTNRMEALAREHKCPVLALHHVGKSGADMRGSQVLFDRADGVIKATSRKGGEPTFLEVIKMRNGKSGSRFAFSIDGIDVETTVGPVSLQVVKNLHEIQPAPVSDPEEAKAKQADNLATFAFGQLQRLTKNGTADLSAWQAACYDAWSDKKDGTRRKNFSTCRKALIEDGLITISGNSVTVTVTADTTVTSMVTPASEKGVTVTVTTPPFKGGGSNERTAGPIHREGDISESSEAMAYASAGKRAAI
ncbi:AAA family ATPase [Agrobacterium tumefaciens]|uniref:AAA family ATPase n=1 Tax=Agrobacterium tumefaciens TaxID=358 RepID=UPI001574EB50|nr:AAA family ATPase [Agrobacterium tumefaciens]NSZ00518.1 AAA family ATPase [Agrobacterium tumefaciens]NSZ40195.1 AAA family ATPase [Agrobacterium tumefaciens]NTB22794.1 AAA family ATPase [Agrobacterium tumefaciens]NTB29304.1 AAA family ATPase [Agrobacterium tumefaciens]NTB33200.1 AAA family ATPase [Agrobacterium tumefaciens]